MASTAENRSGFVHSSDGTSFKVKRPVALRNASAVKPNDSSMPLLKPIPM